MGGDKRKGVEMDTLGIPGAGIQCFPLPKSIRTDFLNLHLKGSGSVLFPLSSDGS